MYYGTGLAADDSALEPLPEESRAGANPTTWVAGGILIALLVGLYAIEKKGPAPFRRAAA